MAKHDKLPILIAHAIMRTSLHFLFLVVIWNILDAVKPSEKNSVRYNSRSHYYRYHHNIYTNTFPVQQVPAKLYHHSLKLSTLELFSQQSIFKNQKNLLILPKTCNPTITHNTSIPDQQHSYKYTTTLKKINHIRQENEQRFLVGKHVNKYIYSRKQRNSFSDQMEQEHDLNMDMVNPLHSLECSETTNNKRKNENDTNTEQSQHNKIHLVEEIAETSPMEQPETGVLNMNWGELNNIIEPLRSI
jgi:hypothetical protein